MKRSRTVLVAAWASSLTIAGCPEPKNPDDVVPKAGVKNVTLADVGLDAAAMDRSADPCTDFYQFACGNWIKNTTIPSDQSRWSRSFSEINDRNEKDLKAILEGVAASGSTPADKQLGDFYTACADEQAIEKNGLGEVASLLLRIRDVTASVKPTPKLEDKKPADKKPAETKKPGATKGKEPKSGKSDKPAATSAPPAAAKGKTESFEHFVASLHRMGIYPFFDITSGPDDKDATTMMAQMDQSGLGLPDRDYYLSSEGRFADVKSFYQGHVETMLALAGLSAEEAKRGAANVMKIETRIAEISKTRVERRDPQGMYNKIDKPGLEQRSKRFDYVAYLDALAREPENASLGLTDFTSINVTSVPFFEKLNDVIADASGEELRHYLTWHVIHATASRLPKRFDEESFKLTQKITGQKEQKPRWKRCVQATDSAVGELLAQAYVKQRFLPESKEAVKAMVTGIRNELERRLPELAWMDPATREQALKKLAKIEYLIGYPDKWREYPFAIDRASYLSNTLRANAFELERRLSKVGKPVDRGEWEMTPPTVNAYYHPNKNHMVFPAGILQPPFFDPKASLPVNMGSIGMVVGHELSHGFDDQGSQYDGDGNLKSWWQPDVRKKFDELASCISDQYGGYEVLPGVKQNGKLTLGEDIADNAGVMLAYKAVRSMRKDANPVLTADGFDEDQQFFLSVGQVWCFKATDEITKLRATVDPHSHPRWRVNGSLRTQPAGIRRGIQVPA